MKIDRLGGLLLASMLAFPAAAQNTNLTRAEVTAIKAKLGTVQKAMGADPQGYVKESEDFNLPTSFSPAQGGKFWPIGSGVSLNYTDAGIQQTAANAEQAAAEFEQKYAAALASGDPNAIAQMTQEMMRISGAMAAAGMSSAAKEDLSVYVQINGNPYATIDPDAVVFESPGVIALRDADLAGQTGSVTLYLDPVTLAETETLSVVELRTPDNGVSNKTGVFNIAITLNGAIADIEAWIKTFDTDAMLAIVDAP